MEEFLMISFTSTNYAMQTESFLKSNGIALQIMPTPREITLSCGLSIRTTVDNVEKIKAFVEKKEITIKAVYIIRIKDRQRSFEQIL